ncbi:hypothetical protein BDW59DRAFT_52137 [Aspergillus cavernicola]|uniref:Chromatin target of PRMT1 protein C-terminal domain-containing protein n=1 Tax=Aspergillus cavernicola TaxID=176166 RepID=A0ABR4IKI3_9EURO
MYRRSLCIEGRCARSAAAEAGKGGRGRIKKRAESDNRRARRLIMDVRLRRLEEEERLKLAKRSLRQPQPKQRTTTMMRKEAGWQGRRHANTNLDVTRRGLSNGSMPAFGGARNRRAVKLIPNWLGGSVTTMRGRSERNGPGSQRSGPKYRQAAERRGQKKKRGRRRGKKKRKQVAGRGREEKTMDMDINDMEQEEFKMKLIITMWRDKIQLLL